MARPQPKPPEVPLPVWQELLAAATEFRAAKPWTWLEDQDVFALIDGQGHPWFSSVLGAAGQVFGLALYRGEAGLRFLLETAATLEDSPRDAAFLQDALLLDWGAKGFLSPEELAMLSTLGHRPKARERNAWPCFRSHSPGWFPWHLDEPEARALTAGTRAALACAELARNQPAFFSPCENDDTVLPTVSMLAAQTGRLTAEQIEWRRWILPPPPVPASLAAPASWAGLRQRAKNPSCVLEFDIFHTLTPTSDGGRPYYPRLGLLADGQSGYIYAMDLAGPGRPWGEQVVGVWGKALTSLRERPECIAIRRAEWTAALQPLADALDIRLLVRDELPFIDEARASMEQHLGA